MHIYVAVALLIICYVLILGILLYIIMPSKSKRQQFKVWIKEKTSDAFCLVMLVALVFWYVVLRRDYD